MHSDLDALDNFLDSKDQEIEEEVSNFPKPPYTNGSLSVVVPMDDMEIMLTQMWKSRQTEPKMAEL